MGTNETQRQINDAIRAGEQALASLQATNEELEQAAGYGRWDIFGGGMLPSLLKRSRMNDARGYIEDAEKALRHFQWVLRNTDVPTEVKLEVSEFVSFADIFWDGFLMDYYVQNRINEARNQITETEKRVKHILRGLTRKHTWGYVNDGM